MQIIPGEPSWKIEILRILDDFREFCIKRDNPDSTAITNTATLYGGDLFDILIADPRYKIYIAVDAQKAIGIITGSLIPQLRKGVYCVEVEEFFVREEYQGNGIAAFLMENMEQWGKSNNAETIRLESGNSHTRGHGFYGKYGFLEYGKAFQKKL